MSTKTMKVVVFPVFALVLAACGSPSGTVASSDSASSIPVTTTTSSITGYGVVQAIDVVEREQAGIGLGTVAGAVVGGVLGNQIGSGSGRTAATVAGVAGGALAGRAIENNSRSANQVYRVAVRMDNGVTQTLVQEQPPGVQIGERVRLDNGVIVERFR